MRIICVCLTLLSVPALGEVRLSGDYHYCAQQASSELDIINCLELELARQEQALFGALEQALETLPPERQHQLESMQKLWLEYRDAKCDFLNHQSSGRGGQTDALNCKLEDTIKRTGELEQVF